MPQVLNVQDWVVFAQQRDREETCFAKPQVEARDGVACQNGAEVYAGGGGGSSESTFW